MGGNCSVKPKADYLGEHVKKVSFWQDPILWPPDAKNWLIWKDPDAGKDWRQEEKGKTGDEMVGWHHWLYGCKFKQAPGVGDGQGSLAYCSAWGRRVWHNWAADLNWQDHLRNEREGINSMYWLIFIEEKRVYTYQYSRYFKTHKGILWAIYGNKGESPLDAWIVKVTGESRLETLSSDIPEKRW